MQQELWAALGDDPFVIAECRARPVLTERLIRNWDASKFPNPRFGSNNPVNA